MDRVARRLRLECVVYRRESHARVPGKQKVVEIAKNIGYRLGRAVGGLGIPRLRRLFVERGAPGWLSSKDHLFCVLKRK